jgi:hypothetical protein
MALPVPALLLPQNYEAASSTGGWRNLLVQQRTSSMLKLFTTPIYRQLDASSFVSDLVLVQYHAGFDWKHACSFLRLY